MPDPILICGASGQTGGAIVQMLLEQDVEVRAAVKDPSRAAGDVRLAGADLVQLDLGDPSTFEAAFDGVERIFASVPFGPEMVEQGSSLHLAAGDAGVTRIVRLSILTAFIEDNISLGRWHRDLDEDLYLHCEEPVLLRPDGFMQTLVGMAPNIREGRIETATGDGHSAFVDANDVARCAVAALLADEAPRGAHDLTGPDSLTYDDAAEVLTEVLGRKVSYADISPHDLRCSMQEAGVPEWMAKVLIELQTATLHGVGGAVTQGVKRLTGTEPVGLADFLEQHKSVFDQAA